MKLHLKYENEYVSIETFEIDWKYIKVLTFTVYMKK